MTRLRRCVPRAARSAACRGASAPPIRDLTLRGRSQSTAPKCLLDPNSAAEVHALLVKRRPECTDLEAEDLTNISKDLLAALKWVAHRTLVTWKRCIADHELL